MGCNVCWMIWLLVARVAGARLRSLSDALCSRRLSGSRPDWIIGLLTIRMIAGAGCLGGR